MGPLTGGWGWSRQKASQAGFQGDFVHVSGASLEMLEELRAAQQSLPFSAALLSGLLGSPCSMEDTWTSYTVTDFPWSESSQSPREKLQGFLQPAFRVLQHRFLRVLSVSSEPQPSAEVRRGAAPGCEYLEGWLTAAGRGAGGGGSSLKTS